MTQEEKEIEAIRACLLKQPFCTFNVLGKDAAKEAEKMIAANFSEIDRKRITIRVHK